jgi:hypothetical protein
VGLRLKVLPVTLFHGANADGLFLLETRSLPSVTPLI